MDSDFGYKALYGTLGTLVGVLITYTTTVSGQNEELVRLTERVESLTQKIDNQMGDRYRGNDARRDFELRDERIERNQKLLEELHRCCNHRDSNNG